MTTLKPGMMMRTTGNFRARIYAIDGADPCPVHGAVEGRRGWTLAMWQRNGESPDDLPGDWSLAKEWIDPVSRVAVLDDKGEITLYHDRTGAGKHPRPAVRVFVMKEDIG